MNYLIKNYNKTHTFNIKLNELSKCFYNLRLLGLDEEQIKKIYDFQEPFILIAEEFLLKGITYKEMIKIFEAATKKYKGFEIATGILTLIEMGD